MKKILKFKDVEIILGKEARTKIAEVKVNINEIHAIHTTEGMHILAVKVHHPKEKEDVIPKCLAFYISKEDYEMAKSILQTKVLTKQK